MEEMSFKTNGYVKVLPSDPVFNSTHSLGFIKECSNLALKMKDPSNSAVKVVVLALEEMGTEEGSSIPELKRWLLEEKPSYFHVWLESVLASAICEGTNKGLLSENLSSNEMKIVSGFPKKMAVARRSSLDAMLARRPVVAPRLSLPPTCPRRDAFIHRSHSESRRDKLNTMRRLFFNDLVEEVQFPKSVLNGKDVQNLHTPKIKPGEVSTKLASLTSLVEEQQCNQSSVPQFFAYKSPHEMDPYGLKENIPSLKHNEKKSGVFSNGVITMNGLRNGDHNKFHSDGIMINGDHKKLASQNFTSANKALEKKLDFDGDYCHDFETFNVREICVDPPECSKKEDLREMFCLCSEKNLKCFDDHLMDTSVNTDESFCGRQDKCDAKPKTVGKRNKWWKIGIEKKDEAEIKFASSPLPCTSSSKEDAGECTMKKGKLASIKRFSMRNGEKTTSKYLRSKLSFRKRYL